MGSNVTIPISSPLHQARLLHHIDNNKPISRRPAHHHRLTTHHHTTTGQPSPTQPSSRLRHLYHKTTPLPTTRPTTRPHARTNGAPATQSTRRPARPPTSTRS